VLVTILLGLLLVSSAASTRSERLMDETIPGSIETGSASCSAMASSSWAIIPDATTSSGTAIEHGRTAAGEASDGLNICRSEALKDGEFSVRFKVISGAHESGGLALRLATPHDYYLVRIDALRGTVSFLLTRNGVAEEIVSVDADVAADTWHTLAVRTEDDSFTVALDESWIFTGFDRRLPLAGQIALWADPRGITRFDRMTLGGIRKSSSWQ
jgi:hypothetical protein